jgi:methylated-DNA-[protein]-cysteine S-methyltransferase
MYVSRRAIDPAAIERMTAEAFTIFDTPIGHCGIAWNSRGICAVQLPEPDEDKTRARLLRRCPQARAVVPAADVQRAIDAIIALLRGKPSDLSAVALDMDGIPAFERRVYEIARAIPPGATLSYGEIASRIGDRSLAPEVGRALGQNPFPIIVPRHRVLGSAGKVGGFSAKGGVATKLRLLALEGAGTRDAATLFAGDAAFGLSVKPPRRSG